METDIRGILRSNAKRLFRESRMTQTAWAAKIGRSEAFVTRLLADGAAGIGAVAQMADRLGVPVADLFREPRKTRKQ